MTYQLPDGMDPDDLHDKRGRLNQTRAVAFLQACGDAPVLVGSDGRLHRYESGVWSADGAAEVHSRLAWLCGERADVRSINNVKAFMLAGYPTWDFGAEQPTIQRSSICVKNGVVDLSTNPDELPRLLPHSPDYRFRIQVPVEWDPKADCPAVSSFLTSALHDQHNVDYMLEWIGYTMLSAINVKVALLLYSPQPDSGKTTMLTLITSLLGNHNVSAVPLISIDNDRFMRANMEGMFANISGDLEADAPLSSAMFKKILGGDELPIERKGIQATKMRNTAKMLFAANTLPQTTDQEAAYFRRWHILPFPNSFGYDPKFLDRLLAPSEMQGLLVLAARGAQRILHRVPVGFGDLPMEVDAATGNYRLEADTVFRFLEEETTPDPNAKLSRPELYKVYKRWTEENGHRPLSSHKFNRKVCAMDGVKDGRTTTERFIQGRRLKFPSTIRTEEEAVSRWTT